MNNLAGPNTSETITGGKTLELSKYDEARKPHKLITDGRRIKITPRTLSTELTCPICLDLLTSTMTTKECLHRFCSDCICTWLQKGNKECPTCRQKVASKRSLRPDPNFDGLISKIWPDRKLYDELQKESMQFFCYQNVKGLQDSIRKGMEEQAISRNKRVHGSYDYKKRKGLKGRPKLKREADGSSSRLKASERPSTSSAPPAATDLQPGTVTVSITPAKIRHRKAGSFDPSNDGDDCESLTADSTSDKSFKASGGRRSVARSRSSSRRKHKKRAKKPKLNRVSSSRSTLSTLASENINSNYRAASEGCSSSQQHIIPPSASPSVEDRMSSWLDTSAGHSQSVATVSASVSLSPSPSLSMSLDGMCYTIEALIDRMKKNGEEIELELIPAKSLLKRLANVPNSQPLLKSRYIKVPPDITVEHLGEYLLCAYQRDLEHKLQSSLSDNNTKKEKKQQQQQQPHAKDQPPCLTSRPEYFYILDHSQQARKLCAEDLLFTVFVMSMVSDEHLMVFFDTSPPDIEAESFLTHEIVSEALIQRLFSAASQPTTIDGELSGSSGSNGNANLMLLSTTAGNELNLLANDSNSQGRMLTPTTASSAQASNATSEDVEASTSTAAVVVVGKKRNRRPTAGTSKISSDDDDEESD